MSIVACGDGGTVVHHDGASWTNPKSHTSENLSSLAFDASLAPAPHGYVLGRQYLLLEYQ